VELQTSVGRSWRLMIPVPFVHQSGVSAFSDSGAML
jgi:hypothetical protein